MFYGYIISSSPLYKLPGTGKDCVKIFSRDHGDFLPYLILTFRLQSLPVFSIIKKTILLLSREKTP